MSSYGSIAAMRNKGLRNLEKILNERIKFILKSKKMTQAALADKMDTTSGYLAELLNLNPKKRWNADLIDRAVNALGIPAWQLFVDPEEVVPPELFQLHEKYNRLEESQKRVIDFILNGSSTEDAAPQQEIMLKKHK